MERCLKEISFTDSNSEEKQKKNNNFRDAIAFPLDINTSKAFHSHQEAQP